MSPRRAVRLIRRKKWWVVVLAAVLWLAREYPDRLPWLKTASNKPVAGQSEATAWRSGQMIQVHGTVIKLLPLDNQGSRHQRWLMRVPGRQKSLLVAHNIDLAPMVPLRSGDSLSLYGQFEDNAKGGIVHWTHHDPAGRHAHGWIEHRGKKYQ